MLGLGCEWLSCWPERGSYKGCHSLGLAMVLTLVRCLGAWPLSAVTHVMGRELMAAAAQVAVAQVQVQVARRGAPAESRGAGG